MIFRLTVHCFPKRALRSWKIKSKGPGSQRRGRIHAGATLLEKITRKRRSVGANWLISTESRLSAKPSERGGANAELNRDI
jgi:hypothetical protein